MAQIIPASWKEEIAIIVLGILGIVLVWRGQDAGLLAAIITAIATVAGVKITRRTSSTS